MVFEYAIKNVLSSVFKDPATVLPAVGLSMVIIALAGSVLIIINKSERQTETHHFFFIANLMSANIVAIITRSIAVWGASLKITYSNISAIRYKAVGMGMSPIMASSIMFVALCLDRVFTVMAPNVYKKIMTKTLACGIVTIIWITACATTYAWFSGYNLADLEDGTCNIEYLEQFEIRAIISPLIISGVLAAIHNIFIFYKIFITTTLDERLHVWHGFNKLCKAWKIHTETQPISTTLLILGGCNIAAGATLISVAFLQGDNNVDEDFRDAIVAYSTTDIVNICMFMQSILYLRLLYTIEEHSPIQQRD